jgi:hypothetical protein
VRDAPRGDNEYVCLAHVLDAAKRGLHRAYFLEASRYEPGAIIGVVSMVYRKKYSVHRYSSPIAVKLSTSEASP